MDGNRKIILPWRGVFLAASLLFAGDPACQTALNPILEDTRLIPRESELIRAINSDPANPALRIDLARFYQLHRYYPQAIEVLEAIISRYPQEHLAHFLLGQVLGSQKRDPDRAIAELKEAVRLHPDSIEYREESASLYYRLQRFPPALEHLDEILKSEPGSADAIYRKAVILHIQGKLTEAESLVDRLPQHEHARVLKAILVQQRGDDAKEHFQVIIRDYPLNLRARYEYGKILLREREFDEARKIFEKIIDEDPFYQHATFQLIKIYSRNKEKEKTNLARQSLDTVNRMGRNRRNFYRSYLRHHPDTEETHFAMAMIYLEIGRGNLAAEELRKTLSMDPAYKEAFFYMAQIEMSSGEYEKALPYLERCLQTYEDRAPIHSLMAQCYLEMNDAPKASEHLQAALLLNPKEPLANRIRQLWFQKSEK